MFVEFNRKDLYLVRHRRLINLVILIVPPQSIELSDCATLR